MATTTTTKEKTETREKAAEPVTTPASVKQYDEVVLPARQGNYELRLKGRIVAVGLSAGMIRLVVEETDGGRDTGLVQVVGNRQATAGRRAGTVWLPNGEAMHVMV